MSPGKAASQTAHSVMMLENDSRDDFLESARRTVIVLEAKNSEQMQILYLYLQEFGGIDAGYYIDEGVNEVDAYSVTSLAAYIGDDEDLRSIFKSFRLYGPTDRDKLIQAKETLEEQLDNNGQLKRVVSRIDSVLRGDYNLSNIGDEFKQARLKGEV